MVSFKQAIGTYDGKILPIPLILWKGAKACNALFRVQIQIKYLVV